MESKIIFVGFGGVAGAFARMIVERRESLAADYGLTFRVTAIATARHGAIISDDIDISAALDLVERGEELKTISGSVAVIDTPSMIAQADADVMFETTPLDLAAGEPAISYIQLGLERGLSVITANKGPLAFAYRNLEALAKQRGVQFRFEGAVLDGAPVFNLAEYCLPGTRICGFAGALNSTTNIILSGIEEGASFKEALGEAQRRGIAEANPDYDIDGWDAAVKAVAIANVLMGADLRPDRVTRNGIRGIDEDELRRQRMAGRMIRLIARGEQSSEGVRLSVAPEAVGGDSPLALASGSTNVLTLETDLMGELTLIERDPGIQQTGYALLSDWLRVELERQKAPKHFGTLGLVERG